MNQYDVFDNPVPRARSAFPFVAILQHKLADTGSERLVAPLVPLTQMSGTSGRVTPVGKVSGVDHVLLVPRTSPVPAAHLRTARDQLAPHHSAIANAIDLLFHGV